MFLGFLSQFCYLLGGFNSWLEQGGYSFLICGCCILFLEPFGEESGLERRSLRYVFFREFSAAGVR